MKILFSDEKLFDIDGVYNSENDQILAVNRSEANKTGDIKQKQKFPQKMMVWYGVCSQGISPLVIFEDGTVDHARYVEEVLLVVITYGTKIYGDDWIFQQDGA